MIHEIASEVYRLIREYGGLTHEQVAAAIGRKHQVVWRWEGNKQKLLPKREQEAALVEKAKLTRIAFGDIMCKVLTPFVGRRITMASSDQYVPSLPLLRAIELYSTHRDDLDSETRELIEDLIAQGRSLDVAAEQSCRAFEKLIVRLIEQARATKGSTTPDPGPTPTDPASLQGG